MIAQHITYGKRITYERVRWCAPCEMQRPTVRGCFVEHTKPNGKPCPNSGKKVAKVEAIG